MIKDNRLRCISASEEISPVISGKRPREPAFDLLFGSKREIRHCSIYVHLNVEMKRQLAWMKERMSRTGEECGEKMPVKINGNEKTTQLVLQYSCQKTSVLLLYVQCLYSRILYIWDTVES